MPVKLKTTPYLTKAIRNVKNFLAILAIISFVILVMGWGIGYLRGYMKDPTLYNPLLITLNNMRMTSKILPPLVICDSALLVIAAIQFCNHLNITAKLRNVRSTRYISTGLTQAQASALERLGVEYIKSLLSIKSEMAKNIWRNIKPGVIRTLERADKNSHIDLNAVIKENIAAAIAA